MRHLLLFLFCLQLAQVHASPLWEKEDSQGIRAEISISKQEIQTNERLTLRLQLRYPESFFFDLNHLRRQLQSTSEDKSKQRLTLVKEQEIQKSLEEGSWTQILELSFEPWLVGHYPTDIESLRFTDEDGQELLLSPPVFEVSVTLPQETKSTKGAVAQLLPITDKPLISLDSSFKEELYDEQQQKQEAQRNEELFEKRSFPWKLVLFITLAFFVYYAAKRWIPRYRCSTGKMEKLDPKERALLALEELKRRQLPEQKLFDSFYTALTAVVRHFIEDQYGVQAPEQTTEEFLAYAKEHPDFLPQDKEGLADFLLYADLVKFAGMNPSLAQCHQAYDSADEFVRKSPRS